MDTERELWDRLENEPERAYRAFKTYRELPSGERTLIEAYRQHVGNPHAAKPSDTWSGWSSQFAWGERARAHDAHLDRIRERGIEKAIEAEAEMQARVAEKARYRYYQLLTLSYERAAQWLEDAQPSDLRAPDVMRIIGLHLDYLKVFGVEEPRTEDNWTPEDEARMTDIIKKVDELEETEDGSGEERDFGDWEA
jgi:hypothetical protein